MQNQQDALLYYAQNYPGDQDYDYYEDLEEEFLKIDKIIRKLLAAVMKNIIGEGGDFT